MQSKPSEAFTASAASEEQHMSLYERQENIDLMKVKPLSTQRLKRLIVYWVVSLSTNLCSHTSRKGTCAVLQMLQMHQMLQKVWTA